MSDYEPGTVAACRYGRVFRTRTGWIFDDGSGPADEPICDLRPLVVIDPEDREQTARLADAFCNARWSHLPGSDECDPLALPRGGTEGTPPAAGSRSPPSASSPRGSPMLEPTAYAAALHVAGIHARQAVRASFRPWFPRCGCGRFVSSAGACGRCDGAVAA